MDLGWNTAIQAVIIAGCTWYMRRGSRRDSDQVVMRTAAQSTSNDILDRVKAVELDLALVKQATVKETQALDHRGPVRS